MALFKDKKQRNKFLFILITSIAVITLIIGSVFLGVGAKEYIDQVNIAKDNLLANNPAIVDAPLFAYGIFLMIMSVISWVGVGLYGNSIFNKKYQTN